jgi:hypothetical protein
MNAANKITSALMFSLLFIILTTTVISTDIQQVSHINDTASSAWLELSGCGADTYIDVGSSTLEAGTIVCAPDTGAGTMSSFTLDADTGTPQSITNGQTMYVTGGAGITTLAAATDTVTITSDLGSAIENTEITDGTITEADMNINNAPADEDILTYESTGAYMYWHSCEEYFGTADLCDGTDAVNDAIYDCTTANACTITGDDVSCTNCVTLTTETANNYVSAISQGVDITIGGTPGEAWNATAGITADAVNGDSLADTIAMDAIQIIDGGASSEVKICDASCGTNTYAVSGGELYIDNDLEVDGNIFGSGADLAEMISTSQTLLPGDVVMIDVYNDLKVVKSRGKYNTLVAGVVSTNPGVILGTSMHPEGIELALTGQVPVKVTNENGFIAIGDTLTTSSTPGYAMRCVNLDLCTGAIIGKALEPLNKEQGTIVSLIKLN